MSFVLLRSSAYRWFGVTGVIVMLLQVLTCITDFNGQPNPLLVLTQSVVYIWTAALGVMLLFKRPVFVETSEASA